MSPIRQFWYNIEEQVVRALMVLCILAIGAVMLFASFELSSLDLPYRPELLWAAGGIASVVLAFTVSRKRLW